MRGQSVHTPGGYRQAGRKRQPSNNYALHSLATYSISVHSKHCAFAPYTDLSGLSHAPWTCLQRV